MLFVLKVCCLGLCVSLLYYLLCCNCFGVCLVVVVCFCVVFGGDGAWLWKVY